MRSLVDYLARALVDDPAQVEVTEQVEDSGSVLRLKVAKSDLGKVIGKKGRTARALRTVLGAAANKANKRYVLEILEPPAVALAVNGAPPAGQPAPSDGTASPQ